MAASWRTAGAAAASAGGGGGAGGGIFLHGDSVALLSSGILSAQGGGAADAGGGGGGGRVLIEVGPGGFTGDVGSINVSGGPAAASLPFNELGGAPGVIAITAVPEPASLVLLGIGLLGVLGWLAMPGVGRPPEPDVPRSCSARCGGPTPRESGEMATDFMWVVDANQD